MELLDKKVTVVGCGKSGQAAARLSHKLKATVKVSESKSLESIPQDFQDWMSACAVAVEHDGHTQAFIEDSDLIVISPGVRPGAPVFLWARQKGIPVWSEIELAAHICPCPIIAVTGSNGKTTVVTLIQKVLEAAGRKAYLCGNIGRPFCVCVEELKKEDYVVVEVSSFQLETIETFKPYIAVLLNFSQNHLDWHKDLDEYWTAKKRICLNQDKNDYAVLNVADERVKSLASEIQARPVFFNNPGDCEKFCVGNPNFLAVMAVAQTFGIDKDVCRKVFDSFSGVEHRLEKVRVLDGVEFVNDSKSTTVEAGRWALNNTDKPVVMICGGRDKNVDFSVLAHAVKQNVKAMIVFGEARGKLKDVFAPVVDVDECEGLEQAVFCARQKAEAGDCVLLSPMCASFDQFKSFEERGEVFKDIVRCL
ncbi:MAG: UDP-N-acetylmuramoyl-L-alanine--D-glutamate ligase [Candidatus Omnitrophica bacterium]|nr:UDP-N-acetylmuramoyl-L-alanine--D-glutamate ligase [Candidatus Omnitrophota bacterium]